MRGTDSKQQGMFRYVSPDSRIPATHPLRPIRAMVAEALAHLDRKLEKMYSSTRRPSIAPERVIRALLLQVLYTIRNERLSVEQLEYNLLFPWFVALSVDEPVWDHSTFSKNRNRLLEADIAREVFEAIIGQARATGLLSDEHFSIRRGSFDLVTDLKRKVKSSSNPTTTIRGPSRGPLLPNPSSLNLNASVKLSTGHHIRLWRVVAVIIGIIGAEVAVSWHCSDGATESSASRIRRSVGWG